MTNPMEVPEPSRSADASGRRLPARRWLAGGLVVALVAAIAAQLAGGRAELVDLSRVSTRVLLVAVACQLGAQLLWNAAMLLPLRTFMARLGYWELFMVRAGGFLAGHVVPVANLAVRMSYLKVRGLGYSHSAWATAVSNVLALLAGGLLAAVALGGLFVIAGSPSPAVVGLTAAVLALGIAAVAVLWYLPQLAGHPWLGRWPRIARLSDFRTGPRTMAFVLALLFARHGFNFVTFGLLFQAVSPRPLHVLSGGLVYAITSPIRVLTITPGNLGVNEWLVAAVANTLSVDLTTGLVVALVFRAVSLAGQGIGVLVGAAWLALGGGPDRRRPDARVQSP
jgi:hypothetical protein